MLITNPKEYERVAREYAVKYAGAPRVHLSESGGSAAAHSMQAEKEAKERAKERAKAADLAVYDEFNTDMIDRFCSMGFDVDRVVAAFRFAGIDRMNGEDYELEEAYMGDVTARLLGEP